MSSPPRRRFSAADNTLVRIFLGALTGRGTEVALAEFTLAAVIALFHSMRKQGPPDFIRFSIGLGNKPSSEWPRKKKTGGTGRHAGTKPQGGCDEEFGCDHVCCARPVGAR